MNILVINASPKANNSITLQSIKFLEISDTSNKYEYLNISPMIKKLEKDFSLAREALLSSDLILFSYPVYTFLAPYALHRFIELVKEDGVSLRGKWGSQYTTSKHFYDTTAHRFINENMLDLGLKVLPGLSQDMEDLTKETGREDLRNWKTMTEFRIDNDIFSYREKERIAETRSYSSSLQEVEKTIAGKVSIVTNASSSDEPLLNMIEDFRRSLPISSTVYNIAEFPFSAGCISCFSCAQSGKCILPDHFDDYLRNEIQNADSIVYAFRVKNHFTDSSMKCYDDRQFCNGHRAVTAGTPTAYIIAGDLKEEENLKDLIEARASVGGNFLSYVVTDESDITSEIKKGASALAFALTNNIKEPKNFFGVGGTKIFRDLIYEMQGMMKADHNFYKKHGYYSDLPHKQKKKILMMKFVGLILKMPDNPKKREMMNKGMLSPYVKVLEKERERVNLASAKS